jgi:antitoxin component YwqK of YwqJK toxin-antitoxin module
MKMQDCEVLLAAAIEVWLCKGDADAARRYLDAGDVEGFERVCRGNYWWIKDNGIAYVFTDGAAESLYANGKMHEQSNYLNGERHGKCTRWYTTGQLSEQLIYANGELHGECTWWDIDGQMREQANYVNGKRHGEYAWWYPDGQMREQANYVNGVKQP